MPETDYYKILNINKTASDSEIKKAYRKLAMKYHPDKTKSDKAAEEKFKKVSEAYAVLSDKEKRNEYDTYGSSGFHQRYSQEDIFRGFDLGDIFKEFGFGGGSSGFGNIFGKGFSGNQSRGHSCSSFGNQRPGQQMKGADLEYEQLLTLKEIYSGTSKTIAFEHKGRKEQLTVKIPKGMLNGKKIRLPGKGEKSQFGGPDGDLYIKASILPDPIFSVEDYNLLIKKEIKLTESLKGTNIIVPTLDGKELNLKIPPGTQHKTKMRLSKLGLPYMKSDKNGDLFVIIHIIIPDNLTDEQKKIIEKLADTGL